MRQARCHRKEHMTMRSGALLSRTHTRSKGKLRHSLRRCVRAMADGKQAAILKLAQKVIDDACVKLPKPVKEKLGELEKASGQPKAVFIGGAAALVALIIWYLTPAELILYIVGTFYPLYATLGLLANEGKPEDMKFWLTYWAIWTMFFLFNYFFDFILSRIPLMLYINCAVLVYLYLPATAGVNLVTQKVLKPHVFPLLTGQKAPAPVEKVDDKAEKERAEVVAKLLQEGNKKD